MTHFKNPNDEEEPLGPEGVPIDAPDNEAPAISPLAVSRMSRAEDDAKVWASSPEYSDQREIAIDDRVAGERWIPGAPGSGQADDSSRGLGDAETRRRAPDRAAPATEDSAIAERGRGEGELRDQPGTISEARQPGPNPARRDE